MKAHMGYKVKKLLKDKKVINKLFESIKNLDEKSSTIFKVEGIKYILTEIK